MKHLPDKPTRDLIAELSKRPEQCSVDAIAALGRYPVFAGTYELLFPETARPFPSDRMLFDTFAASYALAVIRTSMPSTKRCCLDSEYLFLARYEPWMPKSSKDGNFAVAPLRLVGLSTTCMWCIVAPLDRAVIPRCIALAQGCESGFLEGGVVNGSMLQQ